jgi:hypothetical protein
MGGEPYATRIYIDALDPSTIAAVKVTKINSYIPKSHVRLPFFKIKTKRSRLTLIRILLKR